MPKKKKIGPLGMLICTAAAITVGVPLKMANDMIKAERRSKNKRKGRRR